VFATIATHRNSGMEFQLTYGNRENAKDELRPIIVKNNSRYSRLLLNDTLEDAAIFDLVNLLHGDHFALECVHADTL
jgi:hypothetical protein